MTIAKSLFLCCLLLLAGCSDDTEKPLGRIAQIGNAGSLDGPYILASIYVTSVNGGGAGFGYGAVNGYPGASADIGGIGVPKHIEGHWAKENQDGPGLEAYYRISADIDSELAEKKVRTLQDYYQNFHSRWGIMMVEVEKNRLMVLFSKGCSPSLKTDDCTPKEGADPNGYIEKSPNTVTDVAVLFDGYGEVSSTPFPGSPFDSRYLTVNPFHLSQKITLMDNEGRSAKGGDAIGELVRVQGEWSTFIMKEGSTNQGVEHRYRIDQAIDTEAARKKIHTIRRIFIDASTTTKSNTHVHIDDEGKVKIYYALFCENSTICTQIKNEDTDNILTRLNKVNSTGILLFEGQAEKQFTKDRTWETL